MNFKAVCMAPGCSVIFEGRQEQVVWDQAVHVITAHGQYNTKASTPAANSTPAKRPIAKKNTSLKPLVAKAKPESIKRQSKTSNKAAVSQQAQQEADLEPYKAFYQSIRRLSNADKHAKLVERFTSEFAAIPDPAQAIITCEVPTFMHSYKIKDWPEVLADQEKHIADAADSYMEIYEQQGKWPDAKSGQYLKDRELAIQVQLALLKHAAVCIDFILHALN